jgi:hypothetical protein
MPRPDKISFQLDTIFGVAMVVALLAAGFILAGR